MIQTRPWASFRIVPISLCFSLLIFANLFFASTLQASSVNNVTNQDVANYRIKIRRLQHGINTHEDKIKEEEKKERNLLQELEILDKKLAEQHAKLKKLQQRMADQQKLIKKEGKALAKIRTEKNIVENHLKKRIKAYYTMGDIGLLNVTFSTRTLPELLQFHDAFDTLIRYDQDVIRVYRETISDLERARKALTLEKYVLQNFIDQVLQERKKITATKNEKQQLLVHIRTQAKLHKQAIKEMQEAAEKLSGALVALKNRYHTGEDTFLADKGNLPPPVDGIIITLFGQETENKLGILRKSNGITLKAENGTKIRPVSKGLVIFSGYLRGYGNTIVIHHGFQYYTVTSRIEKLLVKKGDVVHPDTVIGIMGDTAMLFDEGLYFEIRHGKQSLDPLLWLDPNRLASAEERTGG
ncbi:murein hydrolase activator EnvC family protein [Desulfomarina sp.]